MSKKLILILLVLTFTACSKEDEPDDNFSPSIEQEKCQEEEPIYVII